MVAHPATAANRWVGAEPRPPSAAGGGDAPDTSGPGATPGALNVRRLHGKSGSDAGERGPGNSPRSANTLWIPSGTRPSTWEWAGVRPLPIVPYLPESEARELRHSSCHIKEFQRRNGPGAAGRNGAGSGGRDRDVHGNLKARKVVDHGRVTAGGGSIGAGVRWPPCPSTGGGGFSSPFAMRPVPESKNRVTTNLLGKGQLKEYPPQRRPTLPSRENNSWRAPHRRASYKPYRKGRRVQASAWGTSSSGYPRRVRRICPPGARRASRKRARETPKVSAAGASTGNPRGSIAQTTNEGRRWALDEPIRLRRIGIGE